MKLNAAIIYAELAKTYTVETTGQEANAMVLGRPDFYMESDREFQSGHAVLATADRLPARPRIRHGAVLVCIGELPYARYYREHLCLITIKERADYFRVYQTLQKIYDRYDEWENTLYRDLAEDSGLAGILADSMAVFGRSLYLLDKSFRFLAATDSSVRDADWIPSRGGTLTTEAMSTFLSSSDLMTEKHGPLRITAGERNILCVNLYSRSDTYEGCLCIPLDQDDFSSRDESLAVFLAGILETAIRRNPAVINDETSSLRRVLQTLVEELPLSDAQRWVLNASNRKTQYVCVILQYTRERPQLPAEYICESFEELFPESAAFRSEPGIVCFVSIETLDSGKDGYYKAELNRRLRDFCGRMRVSAGISNEFRDLLDIRIYYLQAQSALENGRLMAPGGDLYYFASYALTDMIINALGGLPVQAYFPNGFQTLLEHDRSGGVSYLETLKVFLEENMSYTEAARKLYIHRSTLIDRIARIERELQMDLSDSDRRLQLEILLKAIDIEEMLKLR